MSRKPSRSSTRTDLVDIIEMINDLIREFVIKIQDDGEFWSEEHGGGPILITVNGKRTLSKLYNLTAKGLVPDEAR